MSEVQREHVMRSTFETISTIGVRGARIVDIAHAATMSPGHVMHYFRTRDRLLLDTLRWHDGRSLARADSAAAHATSRAARLRIFLDTYLPTKAGDPRWSLWVEASRPVLDPHTEWTLRMLHDAWSRLLGSIVLVDTASHQGPASAAAHLLEIDPWVVETMALLDGLALRLLRSPHDTSRTPILVAALQALRARQFPSRVSPSA